MDEVKQDARRANRCSRARWDIPPASLCGLAETILLCMLPASGVKEWALAAPTRKSGFPRTPPLVGGAWLS